jgi:Protein of unknown function (DUF2911)
LTVARLLIFVFLFASCAPSTPAQTIRKSQLASVMQMVGTSRIEVIYHRPVARGRDLFGSLVPWGRIWSPSADTAAIFKTTSDLSIGAARLPAGSYSIWAIPDRQSWTIIFSSVQPVYHVRYPEGRDVLRVKAAARAGDHMETLAFYFPMVDADSAVLNLHWGKTVVPLSIRAKQQGGR